MKPETKSSAPLSSPTEKEHLKIWKEFDKQMKKKGYDIAGLSLTQCSYLIDIAFNKGVASQSAEIEELKTKIALFKIPLEIMNLAKANREIKELKKHCNNYKTLYEDVAKGNEQLEKSLSTARQDTAKEILTELSQKIKGFRLKRTGQQEVSIMLRELQAKYISQQPKEVKKE